MSILHKLILSAAVLVGASTSALAQSVLPAGFESRLIDVGQEQIHVVLEQGTGDAVILVHGWPQDWSEWRHVMPQLAEDYRVIAVDLRGVGKSSIPSSGYDKATIAADIVAVLDALKIKKAHIVGHDIGGMVAFSFAANHADRALSITIADVPLPGFESFNIIAKDPRAWHFGLHAVPGLPQGNRSWPLLVFKRISTNLFYDNRRRCHRRRCATLDD